MNVHGAAFLHLPSRFYDRKDRKSTVSGLSRRVILRLS